AADSGFEISPCARSQQQVVQQGSGAQLDTDIVGVGQGSFHLSRKVERQPDAEPAQSTERAPQAGVVTVGLERRGTADLEEVSALLRLQPGCDKYHSRHRDHCRQQPSGEGPGAPMVGEHGSNRYAPGRDDKELRHSRSVPLASSHGATTIRPRRYASPCQGPAAMNVTIQYCVV